MGIKLKTDNIAWLILFLLLMGHVLIFSIANAAELKTGEFFIKKTGEFSLPVWISPVLVEAPPRHIDLLPSRTEVRGAHGVSFPLTGLPVDLYEYPVLRFSAADYESERYGLELALDTHGQGRVDTLVRVGDPALFPDMAKEHVDFSSARFVAKDLVYRIKCALGMGGGRRWRYTAVNSKVKDIANGIVSASFKPGGVIFLQKTFTSIELSKTPWLRYEYELPKDLPWIVQIEAKIDCGGLSPIPVRLISKPARGGGKQSLLVNLHDLFQKADPDVKDGRLKELIIHFSLDETAGAAVRNIRIGLGRLELYRTQIAGLGNTPQIFMIPTEGAFEGKINLFERLRNLLSPLDKWMVLGGKLIYAGRNYTDAPKVSPKISLFATYREKVPELFAGERFFLDELSGKELSAVLDQRLFVEKQELWKTGRSDVIFLKPPRFLPTHDGSMLPLASYPLDVKIDGDAYIKADYLFEGGGGFPLYLTLSGLDQHGRHVKIDHLLPNKKPIKVRDLHITKMTLSFRQEAGAPPPPASCIIKNIQISSFKLTTAYHPRPELAYVAFDGGPVPEGNVVWRAAPRRFEIGLHGGGRLQTVHAFPVEADIVGDAVVRFDFGTAPGGDMAYFLRVRGDDKGGYFEKLFPVNQRGEVRLSNLVLHGLDIVVKGGAAPGPAAVLLNQLEVQYLNKTGQEQDAAPQSTASVPVCPSSGGIIYLAPHLAPTDAVAAMARPTLATELERPDVTDMTKLDATLSYAQILTGGKGVVLPGIFLGRGKHELSYVADKGVSVAIDQSLLPPYYVQQAGASTEAKAEKAAPLKLVKIGLLILTGVFVCFLWVKFMPGWTPLVDRTLSLETAFWGVQFVLLDAALYMIFISAAKNAFSWGGLLLVFAYGFAVRYKIRPYLVRKWNFFSERHSAPYFLMALTLLVLCAVMLIFKLGVAADHAAVIVYYLLVTGMAVEFIRFAKESRHLQP
ncbi:MAG: hypothetical protein M0022_02650 [Desulfobacteraceae bacterium]|nr:hypothetical protein [Desulfobacteraceae bacterium]